MDNGFLSLDNFKKWINEQKSKGQETSRLIGLQVESKLKPKRLAKHVDSHEGDLDEITAEFCEYGGYILEVNDASFVIEVNAGSFSIPRCFVKKKEKEESEE
jgi:hypothetical protein